MFRRYVSCPRRAEEHVRGRADHVGRAQGHEARLLRSTLLWSMEVVQRFMATNLVRIHGALAQLRGRLLPLDDPAVSPREERSQGGCHNRRG